MTTTTSNAKALSLFKQVLNTGIQYLNSPGSVRLSNPDDVNVLHSIRRIAESIRDSIHKEEEKIDIDDAKISPEILLRKLTKAILDNDLDAVDKILAKDPPLNTPNNQGLTPIQIATMKDRKRIFATLIQKGADTSVKTKNGKTLLCLAIESYAGKIAQALYDQGLRETGDPDSRPALVLAASHGLDDFVNYLAPQVDVNATGIDKKNILHLAIERAEDAKLANYLDLGVNPKDRDNEGRTAFHLAIFKEQPQALRLLLQKYRTSTDFDPEFMTSLLSYAIAHNKILMASILARTDGINLNRRDENKRTVLHQAVIQNTPDSIMLVKTLLKHGADKQAVDGLGKDALYYAKQSGRKDLVEILE